MDSPSQPLSIMLAWASVAAISILVFLVNIDYTAVNLALVSISDYVEADLSTLQWLLSAYVLAWAALVVPAGRLADIYGRRNMLVLGIGLFILGSLLAGAGSTIEILILGRVIQGIGAAVFMPPCYATVFSVMPSHKQGAAMGAITAAAGLGLSAGPTLAGFILKYLTWRWIFYINIPLGLLVILCIMIFVPKDHQRDRTVRVDAVGVALLSLGLVGVLFALNQIEVWGWKSPLLWGSAFVGALSLTVFWRRDKHKSPQMVPRSLLKNRTLTATVYTVFMNSFNFSLILIMMGLYLQNIMGLSNYESGIVFLWMTLTIGVLSPIGGRLTDRIEMRLLISVGLILMGAATLLMSFLGVSSSMVYVSICLGVAGLGCGLSFPAINTAILRAVPSSEVTTASGLFAMMMMLGNSFGIIVGTSLLVSFGRLKLTELLSTAGVGLNTDESRKLEVLIAQADLSVSHFKGFPAEKALALMKMINESFVYGLSFDMLIGTALGLSAAFIAYKRLGALRAAPSMQGPVIPMP